MFDLYTREGAKAKMTFCKVFVVWHRAVHQLFFATPKQRQFTQHTYISGLTGHLGTQCVEVRAASPLCGRVIRAMNNDKNSSRRFCVVCANAVKR